MKKFRLPSDQIQSIFQAPDGQVNRPPFRLLFRKNQSTCLFAVAVSKKVQQKPAKNKIKRQVRQLFLATQTLWGPNHLIFVVSSSVCNWTFVDLRKQFHKLNQQFLVLVASPPSPT